MATALNVQNCLRNALNPEQNDEFTAKGSLQKVHKFGHEWIEPREQFAAAGCQAQIGIIHSLASAIFHSAWSMTAGKLFTDKEARSFAVQSWKDLGSNVVCALKAILGVISPSAAGWADKKIQSVRQDTQVRGQEENSSESREPVQTENNGSSETDESGHNENDGLQDEGSEK